MTAPKDIFLPPLNREIGSSHPINQVKAELTELLTSFGFSVAEGPEVETEEYNFDKLNIPATHPAREMHDTFYVNNKTQVLRTHTSPVQVRTMLKSKPPIAVVSPGKVRHPPRSAAMSREASQAPGRFQPEPPRQGRPDSHISAYRHVRP